MMKAIIGILGFVLVTQNLMADEIKTHIMDVDLNNDSSESMVFTQKEGRVLWVSAKDHALLKALSAAKDQNREVSIVYDAESGNIEGVQLLEQKMEDSSKSAEVSLTAPASFNPSVIGLEEAQYIFPTLDKKSRWRSQCYNRAHGWAYDMWNRNRVNSQKKFIFFTKRYIKEHKYKWWFHVAPYVLVQTDNGVEEMMMDRSFMEGPEKVKDWSDFFVKTKRACPVVEKYSQYSNYQHFEDCYFINAPMYYHSPRDLEYLETKNQVKTEWDLDEVRYARKQAFKNWKDYNP